MNTHLRRFGRLNAVVLASLLAGLSLLMHLGPASSAEANRGIVLAGQFFGSITGDVQDYQLSADAVLHAPSGDYVGQAGLVEFRSDLETSFSNVQFWTNSAAQTGSLVIVSFTMTGINTGSYQGLTANCAGFAAPGVAVLRVSTKQVLVDAGDREPIPVTVETVVEQWISYDADAIASQIAAFNQLDASVRPGCDAQSPAAEDGEPALPPQAPDHPNHDLPY